MFLISNRYISPSQGKFGQWYICSDTVVSKKEKQASLLVGIKYGKSHLEKNAFFLKKNFSIQDYILHIGDYFAFVTDLDTGDFNIFITPTGRANIYLYDFEGDIIISDDPVSILNCISLGVNDLNKDAIFDFYLFGYPIGESTFVKKITRIPVGYIFSYHYKEKRFDQTKILKYEFELPLSMSVEDAYEELDYLIRQSVQRIIQIQGDGATYCLALSNGLDSRVTGYYFKQYLIDIFGYFFGEISSNEYMCAKAVADKLKMPLYNGEKYESFDRYIELYAKDRPFTDVEWCKYAVGKEHLPHYDAVLSGALGNHLFGGWEFDFNNVNQSDDVLAHEWIKKLAQISAPQSMLDSVNDRISCLFKENNANVLSKKYELYLRSAIPYEKDCEFFTDHFGKPHYSLFYDWDIIRFSLRLPLRSYKFRALFLEFLAKKMPSLHPKAIPSTQILNTHKPIEKWLTYNDSFYELLNRHWQAIEFIGYDLCCTKLDLLSLKERIYKGEANRKEIHFIFRFLTVACLMKNYLGAV